MKGHYCHARGCRVQVNRRFLMCRAHWQLVPRRVKSWVWAAYRPGQEADRRPSRKYLEAAKAAVEAVARAKRAR